MAIRKVGLVIVQLQLQQYIYQARGLQLLFLIYLIILLNHIISWTLILDVT